jgi:heat shock protein HtpX
MNYNPDSLPPPGGVEGVGMPGVLDGLLGTASLVAAGATLGAGVGAWLAGTPGAAWGLSAGTLASLAALAVSSPLLLRRCGARRVDEGSAPELVRTVQALARHADMSPPVLYLVDDAAPLALATGRGLRHGAIVLSTGLLALLSERELRAAIAHELAHIRRGDVAAATLGAAMSGALLTLVGLLLAVLAGEALDGDGSAESSTPAAWGLLLLAPLAALPLRLARRRGREFDADALAARITGDGRALADALFKIEHAAPRHRSPCHAPLAALLIVAPEPARGWCRGLAGHPPTAERIARLRAGSAR